MENYIVIDGIKSELTEEQLEKLGIEPKKNKYEEMFKRVYGDIYFYIDDDDDVQVKQEYLNDVDAHFHDTGNYCRDEEIMKQRALREILNRLLWRASIIAGELDNEWEVHKKHYYIYKDFREGMYRVWSNDTDNAGLAYFPTEKAARDAIENIIIPFTEKYPDFVW